MSEIESQERITGLEMKFSFLEEHVTQQDREILKLRSQIHKLVEEIERVKSENGSDGISIRGDERPPHY